MYIYPHPNHGLFSYEYEKALKENRSVPQYIADRATFLYEEQLAFYKKFSAAIRATGFKGVIIGSCWQAGSGITHFYNLHTDYVVGAIDRHNYFGGGEGHSLKTGKFNNTAMVSQPGSGLLSTGFQHVADRPFQISEWMSLIPTEWTAESSPIIAAYGMGLQGWDASYSFAMDYTHFTSTLQSHGVYNVTSPTQLALYPALAAMVYRSDVKEGEVVANRNVNLSDLKKGSLNFVEKTAQQYDIKSFEAAVPMEALAIGPITISFDESMQTKETDLSTYWNKSKKEITSTTNQLKWDYSGKGYFTINTNGTKGLVGFAANQMQTLGSIKLKTTTDFAVIFISSLEKENTLDNANRILITTVARAQNTGMKFNDERTELLEIGSAPILLEPVLVELQFNPTRNGMVYVLDHTGNRTGEIIPMRKGKLLLDGAKHKAIYYEIVY
jgi:hypothetical protein